MINTTNITGLEMEALPTLLPIYIMGMFLVGLMLYIFIKRLQAGKEE